MSCLNERIDVSFISNKDTRIHLASGKLSGWLSQKIAPWMIVIGNKCIYGDCLVNRGCYCIVIWTNIFILYIILKTTLSIFLFIWIALSNAWKKLCKNMLPKLHEIASFSKCNWTILFLPYKQSRGTNWTTNSIGKIVPMRHSTLDSERVWLLLLSKSSGLGQI